MLVKRLILFLISAVVGFGLTYLITISIGTNIEEYGATYTFFTALSLACAIGVWLDLVMDTKLLPK